ncbi:MAG: hypothetical protein IPI10_00055 [Bacteroidetes bacterium]|nr:hypothetical protein [Bacteroidota bacterium]
MGGLNFKFIFWIRTLVISCLFLLTSIEITFSQNLKVDTLENKKISLGEVLISVNKVEESKRSTAQQAKILDATEISNSQSQTTADLIANSGSATVQKKSAWWWKCNT